MQTHSTDYFLIIPGPVPQYQNLFIFGGSIITAVGLLAGIIFIVYRKQCRQSNTENEISKKYLRYNTESQSDTRFTDFYPYAYSKNIGNIPFFIEISWGNGCSW